MRLTLIAASVVWLLAGVIAAQQTPVPRVAPTLAAALTPIPGPSRELLDKYCVGCHNSRLKTAGLVLDDVKPEQAPDHPEVWEKVIRKLRGRLMPPVGLPRPDDAAV